MLTMTDITPMYHQSPCGIPTDAGAGYKHGRGQNLPWCDIGYCSREAMNCEPQWYGIDADVEHALLVSGALPSEIE